MRSSLLALAELTCKKYDELNAAVMELRSVDPGSQWASTAVVGQDAAGCALDSLRRSASMLGRLHDLTRVEIERVREQLESTE